jgi:DNA polymerase-3 subunit chi
MPAAVEFHTGVEDPLHFACRLLRKASRSGARVLVTAPPALLAALDEALWTFEALDFVPHVRVPGPQAALAPRTPIWLAAGPLPDELQSDAPRLLLNLGAEPPSDPDSFQRVIELVGTEADQRAAGRARWRHYECWGVKPLHHSAAG